MTEHKCPQCGAEIQENNPTYDGCGYNIIFKCGSSYQFFSDGTLYRLLSESRSHLPYEPNCPACNSKLMESSSIPGRWECGTWRKLSGELVTTNQCSFTAKNTRIDALEAKLAKLVKVSGYALPLLEHCVKFFKYQVVYHFESKLIISSTVQT
jgi:hypothetical protein